MEHGNQPGLMADLCEIRTHGGERRPAGGPGSWVTGGLVRERGSHVCLPDFVEGGVTNQERKDGKRAGLGRDDEFSLVLEESVTWFGRI